MATNEPRGESDGPLAWKKLAGQLIDDAGGVDKLAEYLDGKDQTRIGNVEGLLDTLVLIWLAPPGSPSVRAQVNDAYFQRERGKLKGELRALGKADHPREIKNAYFIRAIDTLCRLTLNERSGRYLTHDVPTHGGTTLDDLPVRTVRTDHGEENEDDAHQWVGFKSTALSQDAALYPLLVLFECAPDEVDSLRRENAKFDAAKIARKLNLTREEARRLLSRLDSAVAGFKKRLTKMKQMVPRPFREVYGRLVKLAARPLDRLPDAELRSELFDLSRGLASSFDRENVYGRGIRALSRTQLEGVIDLLLDEHRVSDVDEQRPVLERLMQTIRNVREALKAGDVNRAFMYTPILVLDAARTQRPSSAARLQILLAYTYTLRLTAQYDEYISANQAIIRCCDAIVRKEGVRVLDLPPELERGETLRRIRTYASMNEVVVRFFCRYTTATEERFLVKDYRGLASLPGRMKELMQRDPQAEFIADELLVVSAHLARAAYNAYRTAKGPEDKRRWKTERDARRGELRALVTKHFFHVESGRPDPRRLVQAATDAGEGAAAERTIDVILEVFHDQKELVWAIRAEHVAAGAHVGPA